MPPFWTALCLGLALVCFLLAFLGYTPVWRRRPDHPQILNLVALGLAFWVVVAFWAAVKAAGG